MRAREVQDLLVELSPPLGGEEGFRFGDPDAEVQGMLVTWMATCDALRAAADLPDYWQAFDSLSNPSVTAQGTLRAQDLRRPTA